jgi:hypothetical protein
MLFFQGFFGASCVAQKNQQKLTFGGDRLPLQSGLRNSKQKQRLKKSAFIR